MTPDPAEEERQCRAIVEKALMEWGELNPEVLDEYRRGEDYRQALEACRRERAEARRARDHGREHG